MPHLADGNILTAITHAIPCAVYTCTDRATPTKGAPALGGVPLRLCAHHLICWRDYRPNLLDRTC